MTRLIEGSAAAEFISAPSTRTEFLPAHAKRQDTAQCPLLLLVLGEPPAVVLAKDGNFRGNATGLREVISQPDQVSKWHGNRGDSQLITWHEINQIVRRNFSAMERTNLSVRESIKRLVQSITDSIERHGLQN